MFTVGNELPEITDPDNFKAVRSRIRLKGDKTLGAVRIDLVLIGAEKTFVRA